MNLEQFSKEVMSGVEKRLYDMGIEQELKLVSVEKSNDRHLTGLVYNAPKNNITPCVYMDDLFKHYERGADLDDIIERTAMLMAEQSEPNVDYKKFLTIEGVKDNMCFRLMDYEKNETWLADKVYERFGDFAKVAFISFSDSQGNSACTVLKKDSLGAIGITENEALEMAQNGLNKQEVVLASLNQMMQEMMGMDSPAIEDDERTIFVLTNEDRTLGSALITRDGVLQDISEKIGGSYYVLPSSIHELLIAPMNGAFSREELSNMVREVNASEVSAEDFLSDKVQVFSASRDKLMNAESYEQLQKNNRVSAR